jgi:uncharacterized protein YlzI (FlbEa/FlbD family)
VFVLAATILIQLTNPEGAKFFINPTYVAKVYPTKEGLAQGPNRAVVTGAKCVITMADGKFMSVLETCDFVLRLVEGKVRQ